LGSILGQARGTPGRLHYNLGVALVDAKGTTQDYLTHPSAIPVQMMALKPVFSEVVKAARSYQAGFIATEAAYPAPL
jgi:hypothetical protein